MHSSAGQKWNANPENRSCKKCFPRFFPSANYALGNRHSLTETLVTKEARQYAQDKPQKRKYAKGRAYARSKLRMEPGRCSCGRSGPEVQDFCWNKRRGTAHGSWGDG